MNMENPSLENNPEIPFKRPFNSKSFRKVLVFCVIGIIIFFILFYSLFFSAPKNFPIGQTIKVEQGISLRILSKELKAEKVIRSRVAFETFVILYGGEKHIAPGDYFLENKLPVFEIARRISNRDHHLAAIKITIPEGFDVAEIADTFVSKLDNFNKKDFLIEAQKSEGYLFPDTYFFFSSATELDVFKYMQNNFNKKIAYLLPEMKDSGKNEKEIIIMASIIEREAQGDADRAIISGILWNRIAKKMPLQVDAVPETYKTKGLPENPICNPGIEAIIASIHPKVSSYLYYLHDKNGMVHYASSFVEHKQNIQKYLK